jgi:hypothetical protein
MLLNQFIDISTFWQSQVGRTRKHHIYEIKLLGNIEGTTKNGQSRDNTRRRKNKTKTQQSMCWTPLYAKKHK